MNDLSVSLRGLCKEVDAGYNDLLATSDFVGSLYNTKYSLENLRSIVSNSDYISPVTARIIKANLDSINKINGLPLIQDKLYSLESYEDIRQHFVKRKLVVSIEEAEGGIKAAIEKIWNRICEFFEEMISKFTGIDFKLSERAKKLIKRIVVLSHKGVEYPINNDAKGMNIKEFDVFIRNIGIASKIANAVSGIRFGPDAYQVFLNELGEIKKEYEAKKDTIERFKTVDDKSTLTADEKVELKEINNSFNSHIAKAYESLKNKVKDRFNSEIKMMLDNAYEAMLSTPNSEKTQHKRNVSQNDVKDRIDEAYDEIKDGKIEAVSELAELAATLATFDPKVPGNNWALLMALVAVIKDDKSEMPEMKPAKDLVDEMIPLFIDQTEAKVLFDFFIKVDAVIVKYTKALYKARNNILDTIENFIKEVEDKAGINQDKKENK